MGKPQPTSFTGSDAFGKVRKAGGRRFRLSAGHLGHLGGASGVAVKESARGGILL